MATKKTKPKTPRTVVSKLSLYELHNLATNERIETKTEMKKLRKLRQRYHLVDYSGKTLATAASIEKAIQTANRLNGWGLDCIVDQKDLVAWDLHSSPYGAGHRVYSHATRRY